MNATNKITVSLVSDLYDRSSRIRRLVCSMYFARHDDRDAQQRLLLEALEDLEILDEKLGIVSNASVSDDESAAAPTSTPEEIATTLGQERNDFAARNIVADAREAVEEMAEAFDRVFDESSGNDDMLLEQRRFGRAHARVLQEIRHAFRLLTESDAGKEAAE